MRVERIGDATLYLGDCLDTMCSIGDAAIGMILCDLPYGCTGFEWDVVIPYDKLWKEYRRITRKNARIVLFGVQPFMSGLIQSNKTDFSHMLYWEKNTSTGGMCANIKPMRTVEEIGVFNCALNSGSYGDVRKYMRDELHRAGISQRDVVMIFENKGAHHWFSTCSGFRIPTRENYAKLQATGFWQKSYDELRAEFDAVNRRLTYNREYAKGDVLRFNLPKGKERFHPTQKPVPLCRHLLSVYSSTNDVVFDSCMGSGTTGVAAVSLDRKFIGIEKDPEYFDISCRRIERAWNERALLRMAQQPPRPEQISLMGGL